MFAPRYFAPTYFAPRYWPPDFFEEPTVGAVGNEEKRKPTWADYFKARSKAAKKAAEAAKAEIVSEVAEQAVKAVRADDKPQPGPDLIEAQLNRIESILTIVVADVSEPILSDDDLAAMKQQAIDQMVAEIWQAQRQRNQNALALILLNTL